MESSTARVDVSEIKRLLGIALRNGANRRDVAVTSLLDALLADALDEALREMPSDDMADYVNGIKSTMGGKAA